jgi:hypothetical protein
MYIIFPVCAIQRCLPTTTKKSKQSMMGAGMRTPTNTRYSSCCRGKYCLLNQIQGPVFKCTVCPDYALCESCCSDHDHNLYHPLRRTKRARLSATTDSTIAHDPQEEVRPEMVSSSSSSSYSETSTGTATEIENETTNFCDVAF